MQQAGLGLRAAFVAVLFAAALIVVGAPGVAHAAAGDTWYVTANLYCPAAYTPPGIDVYLTNSANPIEGTGMPSSGITESTALLTDNGDGTYTLVVQVTNPALTLQSLGAGDGAISVSGYTTTSYLVWWDETTEHEVDSRIGTVTFALTSLESTYTIAGCTIYATPLSMSFTSPVILVADFSGVDAGSSDDEAAQEDEAEETEGEGAADESADAEESGAGAEDAAGEDAVEEEIGTGSSTEGTEAADAADATAGESAQEAGEQAAEAAAVEETEAEDVADDVGDDAAEEEDAGKDSTARQATALALARLQELAERLSVSESTQVGCVLANALKG